MALWKATAPFHTVANSLAGQSSPIRTTRTNAHVDESDHTSWHGLIDCQHLAAITQGKQASSQFGHGKYTLHFFVWPKSGLVLADSQGTESVQGLIRTRFVTPSRPRYAALHHLKTLEKKNNEVMMNTDNFDGESHPLLTADLDSHVMAPGAGVGSTQSGNKGAKVIRFSYDNTVSVYGQDSFLADLNQDGDQDDSNEEKMYNLMNDDDDHFGVLGRYEASINPTIDDSGNTVVDIEWDKPLCKYKAYGESRIIVPFNYQFAPNMTIQNSLATFSGIEALGGLIKVEFAEFNSNSQAGFLDFLSYTDNNDYELYVTVTCHSWTPMKR